MYRICLRVLSQYPQRITAPCNQSQSQQLLEQTAKRRSQSGRKYTLLSLVGAVGIVNHDKLQDGGDEEEDGEEIDFEVTTRYRKTRMLRHFISFATVQHQGELFMTGKDFLQAVLSAGPCKEEKTVSNFSEEEFEQVLSRAPSHIHETRGIFRSLGDEAVISYPEYLFLVSVLSKPRDHFLKTFQLIDVDSNWVLSKDEFEIVERLFSKGQDFPSIDTTLKIHFFNKQGDGVITFDYFSHFLDNLQKECLEVEFNEYAQGSGTITDLQFTKLLLSRTSLGEAVRNEYLDRVTSRKLNSTNGVTFSQYSQFMNLLNDIHDLEVALRMFQIAKKPVTPDEFQRAVRVTTGTPLDPRLIELTYKIFDDDGDGALSHGEFMMVMKDRIKNRGTTDAYVTPLSWRAFKRCVQTHMVLVK